ncbi:MAG: hypothetical protein PHD53_00845 [Methylococcales bacterium]|nr:hypothetical protein [Methylococcales bacterium]
MATQHYFDVDEAVKYGVECSILLSNIRFWLQKNKANGVHIYDGFYWTYNSAEAYENLFPYMKRRSISNYLKTLCDNGILKTGNYNKLKIDKTYWYTIPLEFSVDLACKPEDSTTGKNCQWTGKNCQWTGKNCQWTGKNCQWTGKNCQPLPDSKQQILNTDSKPKEITTTPTQDFEKFVPPDECELTVEKLGGEMQACFEWAKEHDFWNFVAHESISKFLKLYSSKKPDGLRQQFERRNDVKQPTKVKNNGKSNAAPDTRHYSDPSYYDNDISEGFRTSL